MRFEYILLRIASANEVMNNFNLHDFIRDPKFNGTEFIYPQPEHGLMIAFAPVDHYLIDYDIQKQVTFTILSPMSNYLSNLAGLPFSRFCGMSPSDEQKYLQSHIDALNKIWQENIDGYEDFINNSGRHRRGVVQFALMTLIALYHISKYRQANYEQSQFDEHLVELSSKLSSLDSTTANLLL